MAVHELKRFAFVADFIEPEPQEEIVPTGAPVC